MLLLVRPIFVIVTAPTNDEFCISDASNQFDATVQANMIAIAIEYRQAEKNTPPVRFTCLSYTIIDLTYVYDLGLLY